VGEAIGITDRCRGPSCVVLEPVHARAVKQACPGWADRTYHVFLPKHRAGNPRGETELYVRVAPGLYRLHRSQARQGMVRHRHRVLHHGL
jgi:hypothetical protein